VRGISAALRIVLVDDQPLFRKALASPDRSQMDMRVVAQGGWAGAAALRDHAPICS
jgi:hypothetical protein